MENTEIIQKARAKAEMWLNDAYDKATRTEVERLLNASDPTELIDSFYNDLEFGTGGLRGIMGVGSNRMNIYTVGAATQGFANYINRLFPGENNSVCIGHDCRHHSREYAETTAAIFSANGITAYLFESLRPTPECRLLSVNWDVKEESSLPLHTTRKNITVIRLTGMMVHS